MSSSGVLTLELSGFKIQNAAPYGQGRWLVQAKSIPSWPLHYYLTEDDGATWTDVTARFDDGNLYDITTIVGDGVGSVLLCGTKWDANDSIFVVRTTDGGITQSEVLLNSNSGFFDLSPSHRAANGTWILVRNGHNGRSYIYRSTDAGLTWATTDLGDNTSALSVALGDGVWVVSGYLTGTGDVVFRSTDDGVTWSAPIATGVNAWMDHLVYAAGAFISNTYDGFVRSTDGGLTWVTGSFGGVYKYLESDGTTILVGSDVGALAATPIKSSVDGGATWQTVPVDFVQGVNNGASFRIIHGGGMWAAFDRNANVTGHLYQTETPLSWLDATPNEARSLLPSPVGSFRGAALVDYGTVTGASETYYAMDLIGPGDRVRAPISSWQATLQVDRANYVQCVIPAASEYLDAIGAQSEFVVYRGSRLPGGNSVESELARSPIQSVTYQQGPFRVSCTISGYAPGFAPGDVSNQLSRVMTGIRSSSIDAGGNRRVRADIDWLLRPGMSAIVDGQSFVAAYISYYVGSGQAYMDVGERAL